MKTFKINGYLTVECETVKRRPGGFAHVAKAFVDGEQVEQVRLRYDTDVTEQWEYKTVLLKLADDIDMTLAERAAIVDFIVKRSK